MTRLILLILGVIAVMFLLYAVDRTVKARVRARRLRMMTERLAAAVVRAEEQEAERQAEVAASGALTSFMPAINRPVLPIPGRKSTGEATPAGSRSPADSRPGADSQPPAGCTPGATAVRR